MEQGQHAELLAQDGLYASLWARQREADEAREVLAHAREAEEVEDHDGARQCADPHASAIAEDRLDEDEVLASS
jgi:ATP-binding cassette subfamily B protein